jgi:hypothetical protein
MARASPKSIVQICQLLSMRQRGVFTLLRQPCCLSSARARRSRSCFVTTSLAIKHSVEPALHPNAPNVSEPFPFLGLVYSSPQVTRPYRLRSRSHVLLTAHWMTSTFPLRLPKAYTDVRYGWLKSDFNGSDKFSAGDSPDFV